MSPVGYARCMAFIMDWSTGIYLYVSCTLYCHLVYSSPSLPPSPPLYLLSLFLTPATHIPTYSLFSHTEGRRPQRKGLVSFLSLSFSSHTHTHTHTQGCIWRGWGKGAAALGTSLRRWAGWHSVSLRHAATHCNKLRQTICTLWIYDTLQHTATNYNTQLIPCEFTNAATYCNKLQHTVLRPLAKSWQIHVWISNWKRK